MPLRLRDVRFDSFYTKDTKVRDYNSIIDGFNVMAHKKNVKTWIRMIEEEESKILFEKMEIDYLQGKYLAPLKRVNEG